MLQNLRGTAMVQHFTPFLFLIIIIVCDKVHGDESTECTTPNGEKAECKSLFACEKLQSAISNPKSAKFVEASKCGDFKVCCGSDVDYKNAVPSLDNRNSKELTMQELAESDTLRREYVLNKLLPTTDYCGYQHSDDHFIEGSQTALDEFPWLVHIPYQSSYLHPTPGSEFKCTGFLISNRFVLTSTFCTSDGFLNTVKLGQYHKKQNVSCEESLNFKECTEPAIELGVARKTDIPNTNLFLLALEKPIVFTDYVRPICLPLKEKQRPKIGDTVATSGWGEEDIKGRNVTIKKKLEHTLVNASFCEDEDPVKSMCSMPKPGNSGAVCNGDEGGPIMYQYKHQWFAAGILHYRFNTEKCSTKIVKNTERITQNVIDGILDYMFYMGFTLK